MIMQSEKKQDIKIIKSKNPSWQKLEVLKRKINTLEVSQKLNWEVLDKRTPLITLTVRRKTLKFLHNQAIHNDNSQLNSNLQTQKREINHQNSNLILMS